LSTKLIDEAEAEADAMLDEMAKLSSTVLLKLKNIKQK